MIKNRMFQRESNFRVKGFFKVGLLVGSFFWEHLTLSLADKRKTASLVRSSVRVLNVMAIKSYFNF